MRAQTSHGHQVYIFHGDADKMRKNHSVNWSLYGLWTHSSSPVVQYVCTDEDDPTFGSKASLLGIELLGRCIDASRRTNNRADGSLGRQLVIYNNGNSLQAELFDGRTSLSPARNCSIKELPMESPFGELLPRSVARSHERESTRLRARNDETTNSRRGAAGQSTGPQTNKTQWYTTKTGEERLRRIQGYCTQKFPPQNDKVAMSRDTSTHDLQLTIHHNDQTFVVDFPDNFPNDQAQISFSSFLNPTAALARNDQIRSGEDIVAVVRKYCACYKCKY